MRVSCKTEQFAVYDDFLSLNQLSLVRQYIQTATYCNPPAAAISEKRRNRLVTRSVRSLESPLTADFVEHRFAGAPATPRYGSAALRYPSGMPIDLVIRRVLSLAHELKAVLGAPGRDWDSLAAAARLYPKGTHQVWHNDGHFQGAFIFYAHREWDVRWGGMLMVAGGPPPSQRAFLRGLGSYVYPKPNRCVFVRRGVFHCVSRISKNAGENLRMSIAGYVLKTPARTQTREEVESLDTFPKAYVLSAGRPRDRMK